MCLAFANPVEGDRVLDVCCGKGTLTSLIAASVGSGSEVVGVDICKFVLGIARTKTRNVPITFLRAKADNLPLAPFTFDKCFISFGLHHMPEQARLNALREARKALRSGGTLFVVEYNLPTRALARLVFKTFVKFIEGEAAYKMVLDDSLLVKVQQAGFAVNRREVICGGMVQLVENMKGHNF